MITINTVDGSGAGTSVSVNGTPNVNTDGLEANQAQWETVVDGIRYQGDWAYGKRYSKGDLVRWSPGMWRVTTGHWATTDNMDETKFSLWLPGLEFEQLWNTSQYYQQGDIVLYGGYTYVALQSNIGVTPAVTDSSTATIVATFEGNLTGDVTGNADTATVGTSVTASANNSTDETCFPTFVDGATGTQGIETDTGFTYNPR